MDLVIVGAVQGFLTLDPSIQRTDTILKRMGSVVFLVYCCLPFIILSFNAIWRLRTGPPVVSNRMEKYDPSVGIGRKSWDDNRTVWKNSAILLVSASLVTFEYVRRTRLQAQSHFAENSLCTLLQGIKVAQGFESASIPRWYWSKATFYACALLPETLALYLLIFSNMAERYAGLAVIPKEGQLEKGDEATVVDSAENGNGIAPVKKVTT